MQIEIFSDTICPWCLIGKRRLDRALQERPQEDLQIAWRAFQLNPNMPVEGIERSRYLNLKFGGVERANQVYEPIREAGRAEGIPFALDKIPTTPNTLDSHRLIRFAQRQGLGEEVLEALFAGYFFNGQDLGDQEVLAKLGAAAGLDHESALAFLQSGAERDEVAQEDARARQVGIQGVPTYIFDNKYVLSGAHPPEVLYQLFDIVNGERAADEAAEAEA